MHMRTTCSCNTRLPVLLDKKVKLLELLILEGMEKVDNFPRVIEKLKVSQELV